MDPYFDFFLENFGPAIDRRDVPSEVLERFKGKLPDQMLAYWPSMVGAAMRMVSSGR